MMGVNRGQSNALDVDVAKTQALLVGDWQQPEFAAALGGIAASREWHRVDSIEHAGEQLIDGDDPIELIFVAQPLPGAYRQSDFDRLQQLSPLTRLVVVAGTWCEGELRTGQPLQGVIRLYWYELASWWESSTRRQDAGLCPHWSQPLEHAQAGRYMSDASGQSLPARLTEVLVSTPDSATFDTLRAALGVRGLVCNRDQGEEAESAGIWDGSQLGDQELEQLHEFCQRVTGPVTVLLDFPRVEHLQQIQTAGAASLFAKPYVAEEVAAALLSQN